VSGSALALTAIAGSVAGLGVAGAAPASAASATSAGAAVARSAPTRPSSVSPLVYGGGKGGGGKVSQPKTPKQIARQMLGRFHWSAKRQFPYLDKLWARESGWNVHAVNPYSGAAGIPQAVPGSKMASAGPDWPDNARTQIRWGLRYIRDRYGSPRGAWDHEASVGWY
jgi:hypothetical protein